MKMTRLYVALITLAVLGILVGCRGGSTASPDVMRAIRQSLDQAGLKSVSVTQDRDKGIVTLGGTVSNMNDKAQAEALAKSLAGTQVVADEIAVIPPGTEDAQIAMNSDLDQGIEKNLDAALIQNNMHGTVRYSVKNGVVTLTGQVNSEDNRAAAQSVASMVPNVHQVVNVLQVKNQKASSTQQ